MDLGYIFNICILVGFALPILNILTGWFGDILSFGADIDVDADIDTDVDVDAGVDAGGGLISFNIMCLCLFLVVFGVMGQVFSRWMTTFMLTALLIAASLVIAAVFYFLLYRLVIVRLRKSRPYSISYDDLRGKRGRVTLRITDDSLGTISVRDSTGAYLSFRAKKDPDLKSGMAEIIQKGETVIVTEADVKEKICYVSTLPGDNAENQFIT